MKAVVPGLLVLLLTACNTPEQESQEASPAGADRAPAPRPVVASLSAAGQPVADLFQALQAGDEEASLERAGELLDAAAVRDLAARPSDWSVVLRQVGPGGSDGDGTTVQVHFQRLAGSDFRSPPLCPFSVRLKHGQVTQRYSCEPY